MKKVGVGDRKTEVRGRKSGDLKSFGRWPDRNPDWDIHRDDWDRIGWREVQWVRQVRDRGCILGIGFWRDRLIQFLGDENDLVGLARGVSPRESVWLLGNYSSLELWDRPDVEADPRAWRKWLRLILNFEF